jgi:hypothetical protein
MQNWGVACTVVGVESGAEWTRLVCVARCLWSEVRYANPSCGPKLLGVFWRVPITITILLIHKFGRDLIE